MGRVLGVDHGERRIGLAVSDPDRVLATAHALCECRGEEAGLAAVAAAAAAVRAELIVVGLPLNMNGSVGPAAQRVLAFARRLGERAGVPVETWDERLTTASAEAVLIEAGTRRAKRRRLVDRLAAQIMLQHYLDAHAVDGDE